MKTRELLTIIGLGLLGLFLFCSMLLLSTKNPKMKKQCNSANSLFLFGAISVIAVSQYMKETEDKKADKK
ncbi:MAG TPA: hypothetical protein EYO58_11755 [Flavobacteriales bacterium]|nr:hypothetical protein [Flavobacteriales bacterium]